MTGCGGDITDLAVVSLLSLITRLCLQIIIKLSPLATTGTSEEADTVRHHQPDLSLEIIADWRRKQTQPGSQTSGNKTGEMETPSCLHLTANYYPLPPPLSLSLSLRPVMRRSRLQYDNLMPLTDWLAVQCPHTKTVCNECRAGSTVTWPGLHWRVESGDYIYT